MFVSKINLEKQKEDVITLINKIRPYINSDGGDIELVDINEGIVYVKMLGACEGCHLIDVTINEGLETMLVENVDGIIAVEVV